MSPNKKKWMIITLVGIAYLLWLARGTPKSKIPYPKLTTFDTLQQGNFKKGRPIPYNELLLSYRRWFGYDFLIYNDVANYMPEAQYKALTPQAILDETGADRVIMNGPRFWVLDEIWQKSKGPTRIVANHKWNVPGYGHASIKQIVGRKAYEITPIKRVTTYVYYPNTYLYVLKSPDGREFIMQAASKEVDDDLEIGDLKNLGNRLKLPNGWSFEARTTKERFENTSAGSTYIVQDDLLNTYQLNMNIDYD